MESWYSKDLGDAMLAQEALGRIEDAFRSRYPSPATTAAGDVAIFVRHVSDGRLHCRVEVFFSPALVIIATRFGATECPRPSADNLGLLVGAEESWSMLFPEDPRRRPVS